MFLRNQVTALAVAFAGFLTAASMASAQDGEAYPLSSTLGDTLDAAECQRYGLLREVDGLHHAEILRDGGDFRLRLTLSSDEGFVTQERSLSRETVEATQRHVAMVDRRIAWEEDAGDHGDFNGEQWHWFGLILHYATLGQVRMSTSLLDDLRLDLQNSGATDETLAQLAQLKPEIEALESSESGLHGGIRRFDNSGRYDLIRYSGLWGIWAAIALPVSFESEDAKAYAASLMVIPAASVLTAVNWSRDRNLNKGRSAFISLGGNLGLWHGMGWTGLSGADGPQLIAAGLGASTVGIILGAWAGDSWDVTEGHGQLTSSSLWWGMWYGMVFSMMATDGDGDGDEVLRTMLWTSVGTVSATGILARGSSLRQNQVRLINLGGILGAVFGFGVDVLIEVNSASTAMAIAGAGTTAGLIFAWQAVRGHPTTRSHSLPAAGVQFGAAPDHLNSGRPMATLSFQANF